MKEYCVERYNSLHAQNVQFQVNRTKSMLQYKTLIQLSEYVHNRWPKHAEGYTDYNIITSQHISICTCSLFAITAVLWWTAVLHNTTQRDKSE